MKKQGIVNINGYIYPDQSEYAGDWGVVSLKTIQDALALLASDLTEMVVKINTPGGVVEEAFAIINELKDYCKNHNLKFITRASGQVASAGVAIFVAGEVREVYKTSSLFVHNPNIDPWNLGSGGGVEAKDLEEAAAYLRSEEDRLITYTSEACGVDAETLRSLMNDQTTINADSAIELKLATVVIDDKVIETKNYLKMVLNYKKPIPVNNDIMKNNPLLKALSNLFTEAKKHGLAVNSSTLDTADGKVLEFSSDTPTVGDTVTIDGVAAADGSYTMADESTVVIKDGKCESITPKATAAEPVNSEELKVANQKIIELEAANKKLADEMAEFKSTNATALKAVNDLTDQLKNVKSGFKPTNRETQNSNSGKGNEGNTSRAQAAIDRKAEREQAAAGK